ncbi:MAG: tryptophan synthase subunit alpha [Phycisphaerales bacterium]
MNRIETIFAQARAQQRRLLMPFVCGGSPTLDSTHTILPALERAGASIVEVGIPFSDPIADGPVIAAAMHDALQKGATPAKVFEAVRAVRPSLKVGLVAMVSISIVQRIGLGRFAKEAAAAGFDGVILPDVPLEEAQRCVSPIREAGLTCSLLVAPTTPPDRAEKIARACSGFVYLLARLGITGASGGAGGGAGGGGAGRAGSTALDASAIAARVAALRQLTDLPIACGFGIATAEHVRAVVAPNAGNADAAIVGSALVDRLRAASDPAAEAEKMVRDLATGLA